MLSYGSTSGRTFCDNGNVLYSHWLTGQSLATGNGLVTLRKWILNSSGFKCSSYMWLMNTTLNYGGVIWEVTHPKTHRPQRPSLKQRTTDVCDLVPHPAFPSMTSYTAKHVLSKRLPSVFHEPGAC